MDIGRRVSASEAVAGLQPTGRGFVASAHAIAIVVASLTLLSLLLRMGIAFHGGVWRDEALLLAIADLPSWTDMLAYLRFHESHPPLFYAMMRTWRAVFGSSDSAALALPILLGASLVPVSFLAGKSLFDARTGLVAAAVVTVLPSLNDDGSTARPYSFLALLVLVSCYFAAQALLKGGARRWGSYGFVLVLIVYSHNWGWVVVAGTAAAVLICSLRGPQREQRNQRIAGAFLSMILLGIAYSPWATVLIEQSIHAGHPEFPVHSVRDALELTIHALLAVTTSTVVPALTDNKWMVLPPLALSMVVLITGQRRGGRYERKSDSLPVSDHHRIALRVFAITFLVSALVATVVSPFSDLLVERCLSTLAPLSAMLIGYATSYLSERRHRSSLVIGAGAIAIVMAGVYAAGLYSLLSRPRSNAKESATLISMHNRPTDLVVITPGYLSSSINHYLPGRKIRQLAYPDTGSSKLFSFSGVWQRVYDPGRLNSVAHEVGSAEARGERVWLLTDGPSRVALSNADSNMAARGDWSAMVKVRTHDIRGMLFDTYGEPAWKSRTGPVFPRQELILVELFSPASEPRSAANRTNPAKVESPTSRRID
jgi:4-amino-4-deoxy-L-arabinose transferase-like glycosyltransferase